MPKTRAKQVALANAKLITAQIAVTDLWLEASPGTLPDGMFQEAIEIDRELMSVRSRLRDLAGRIAKTEQGK